MILIDRELSWDRLEVCRATFGQWQAWALRGRARLAQRICLALGACRSTMGANDSLVRCALRLVSDWLRSWGATRGAQGWSATLQAPPAGLEAMQSSL